MLNNLMVIDVSNTDIENFVSFKKEVFALLSKEPDNKKLLYILNEMLLFEQDLKKHPDKFCVNNDKSFSLIDYNQLTYYPFLKIYFKLIDLKRYRVMFINKLSISDLRNRAFKTSIRFHSFMFDSFDFDSILSKIEDFNNTYSSLKELILNDQAYKFQSLHESLLLGYISESFSFLNKFNDQALDDFNTQPTWSYIKKYSHHLHPTIVLKDSLLLSHQFLMVNNDKPITNKNILLKIEEKTKFYKQLNKIKKEIKSFENKFLTFRFEEKDPCFLNI